MGLDTAIHLIKLFQYLDFFTFFNIPIPENVKAFFQYFLSDLYELVPNPLTVSEKGVGCQQHPILAENDQSCIIGNNIGSKVLAIGFILALKGVLMLISFGHFAYLNLMEANRLRELRLKGASEVEINQIPTTSAN